MALVKSVEIDIGVRGDAAAKAKLDAIDARAEEMKRTFPEFAIKIDSAAAAEKLRLFRADLALTARDRTVNIKVDVDRSSLSRARSMLGGLLGGAGKGIGGLAGVGGTGGGAGGGLLSGLAPAGAIAGVGALPFIGQFLAGSIVAALGTGLAGLGIAGSMITGKAPKGVTANQLTAAQDRLAAAQAAQAALGKKATPAQIASAAGSVVSAQGSLSALQAQSAASAQFQSENKLQLQTKKAFSDLADSAKDSLASIGRSFVPVMKHIFDTAKDVLGTLTPVFAGAVTTISGPFSQFASVFLRTFAQPAVSQSIQAVADAFAGILTALTPQLGGIMAGLAQSITNVARAVSENPKAFADFLAFLLKVPEYLINTIAWLAQLGNWALPRLIRHLHDMVVAFVDFRHRTAVVFDGIRHDIAHVYDLIFNDSIGAAIRIVHNVETQFNSLRHGTAVIFDGIRHDIAHYWDMTFSNTIGRIQRGFHDIAVLFDRGRHDIAAGFGKLPGEMLNIGKAAVGQLWAGMKSIAGTIVGWVKGFAKNVLDVLHLGWLIKSPSGAMYSIGKNLMLGLLHGIQDHGHLVRSALGASVGAAAAGAVGGAPGQVQALARTMAAARGWTGLLWDALNAVEMREAGWQLGAVNPTSGAYGIAQFINGPAEYYQFGGNPGTAAGQITGFLNYVAQRYANPLIALGHEQRFGWYDQGGFLPPGLSLAYNTTGRPEPVGAARGTTYVINVAVSPLARPADTGREVVAAIKEHERRAGRGWRTP